MLDGDGAFAVFVNGHRERAAGVQLRHDVANFRAGKQRRFFHDQGAVEVLAALRRQKKPAFAQCRHHALVDGLGDFRVRAFADAEAADLAGGTADHENFAGFRARDGQQFADRLRR